VAQGIEGSDERMSFSGIFRDARRGVDTVLVFFWKHWDPSEGSSHAGDRSAGC